MLSFLSIVGVFLAAAAASPVAFITSHADLTAAVGTTVRISDARGCTPRLHLRYMALRHWGGGGLRFFVLQAVGISVEESIVALGRRLGLDRWPIPWKLLGYFWVWTWFAFTAPRWLDPLRHVGVFEPFFHSWVILPLMERP
ncbi:hypothetical protein C8F01DRAFT_1323017 [Mycena amicta]|nr:hypothetical protein C8F01DRAFT_1323017 [Mycena amicta]